MLNEKKLSEQDELFFLNREKAQVKKEFSNKFLSDLGMILAKCFATTKKKKENFITQERLELDFLKLLQKVYICLLNN